MKIVKRNLIPQKTWPPGGVVSFPYVPVKETLSISFESKQFAAQEKGVVT